MGGIDRFYLNAISCERSARGHGKGIGNFASVVVVLGPCGNLNPQCKGRFQANIFQAYSVFIQNMLICCTVTKRLKIILEVLGTADPERKVGFTKKTARRHRRVGGRAVTVTAMLHRQRYTVIEKGDRA